VEKGIKTDEYDYCRYPFVASEIFGAQIRGIESLFYEEEEEEEEVEEDNEGHGHDHDTEEKEEDDEEKNEEPESKVRLLIFCLFCWIFKNFKRKQNIWVLVERDVNLNFFVIFQEEKSE